MSMNTVLCPACRQKNRLPTVSAGRARCGSCRADLPWLVDAGAHEFDELISTASVPVLVDLWAPWCGPCRTIAPMLEQVAASRAGKLRVVKVNVDEAPGVSAKLGVQGIPTMVLFRDGTEAGRQIGALPQQRLTQWLDQVLDHDN